jgi:hypothetical protein
MSNKKRRKRAQWQNKGIISGEFFLFSGFGLLQKRASERVSEREKSSRNSEEIAGHHYEGIQTASSNGKK